jgi:phage-related protein
VPKIRVVFYREDDGSVPVLEWLDAIPLKARDKCFVRIERLGELGYELHRPEADYLRDGIYELRIRLQRTNYRILYFFYKEAAVALSHGLTKKHEVPSADIDRAIERKEKFVDNPRRHIHVED